jgi:hypothetical protein
MDCRALLATTIAQSVFPSSEAGHCPCRAAPSTCRSGRLRFRSRILPFRSASSHLQKPKRALPKPDSAHLKTRRSPSGSGILDFGSRSARFGSPASCFRCPLPRASKAGACTSQAETPAPEVGDCTPEVKTRACASAASCFGSASLPSRKPEAALQKRKLPFPKRGGRSCFTPRSVRHPFFPVRRRGNVSPERFRFG